MKIDKIIVWELVLLLSSVLIFRSVWTLLDRIPLMNQDFMLVLSLIIGLIFTVLGLLCINKK